MKLMFQHFVRGESGAVTVDWVVLTAGLIALTLAAMTVVSNGVEDISANTNTSLSGIEIQTAFE